MVVLFEKLEYYYDNNNKSLVGLFSTSEQAEIYIEAHIWTESDRDDYIIEDWPVDPR